MRRLKWNPDASPQNAMNVSPFDSLPTHSWEASLNKGRSLYSNWQKRTQELLDTSVRFANKPALTPCTASRTSKSALHECSYHISVCASLTARLLASLCSGSLSDPGRVVLELKLKEYAAVTEPSAQSPKATLQISTRSYSSMSWARIHSLL